MDGRQQKQIGGTMMKTLVICISVHHGNTRKIAQAMAEVLDADMLEPANIVVFHKLVPPWAFHKVVPPEL